MIDGLTLTLTARLGPWTEVPNPTLRIRIWIYSDGSTRDAARADDEGWDGHAPFGDRGSDFYEPEAKGNANDLAEAMAGADAWLATLANRKASEESR